MASRVLAMLEQSAVALHLVAGTATEVIAALGARLLEAGYVHETFVDAALAREQQLPTGLPLGGDYNAAIPHTDVEHVRRPGLALATLTRPVLFQNMLVPEEAVPVRLVFLMALDQPKTQVEMLQEIAGILQEPERVARLVNATDYQEIARALA